MSRLVLHRAFGSPPARAVQMLANILDLKLEIREVNILKGEHRKPEFRKINPMQTVPVLEDGNLILSESNAIMKYLVQKYGGEHQERLYPRELETQAVVDQCMFFSAGVLFPTLRSVGEATFMYNLESPSSKHRADIENAYSIIDHYLQSRPYIATDRLTIADLSAGATAIAIQNMHKVDAQKFPRCTDWISRLEQESFFKTINKEGAVFFGKMLNTIWEKNKQKNKQKI